MAMENARSGRADVTGVYPQITPTGFVPACI
jgi:hypothetical protein